MLQADSESECQAWVNAIQAAVSKAYRDASQNKPSLEEHLSNMSDGKENPSQQTNRGAS